MSSSDMLETMHREMTIREGAVEALLDGQMVEPNTNLLTDNAYLLHAQSGAKFLYRKGQGIMLERPDGLQDSEVLTWLEGSVRNAVASLNGFVPLHASGLAMGGQVVAFAGPSGAGKSTLAAALLKKANKEGVRFFSDDTIIFDPTPAANRIACLPGPARWKLNERSLRLAGMAASQCTGEAYGKFVINSDDEPIAQMLPLGQIFCLHNGVDMAVNDSSPAMTATTLINDPERKHFYLQAFGRDYASALRGFADVCQSVKTHEVVRTENDHHIDDLIQLILSTLGREN